MFRSDSDFHQTCTNIRLDDSHRSCGTIGNDSHDRFRTCIYTGLVVPSNVKTFTPVPLCATQVLHWNFPWYCLLSIVFHHTKPPWFNLSMLPTSYMRDTLIQLQSSSISLSVLLLSLLSDVEQGSLVVAEGERVRQYPREVLREGPVSAHRGTGGESLNIRGHNQPSIYTCTEPVM